MWKEREKKIRVWKNIATINEWGINGLGLLLSKDTQLKNKKIYELLKDI